MVDQDIVTVFLAVTAVAVLIQAGILVGFCLLSSKLNRQVNSAMDVTRDVLGRIQNATGNLQDATDRFTEFSSKTQEKVRELQQWMKRSTA